jgi:hypothetical protein
MRKDLAEFIGTFFLPRILSFSGRLIGCRAEDDLDTSESVHRL